MSVTLKDYIWFEHEMRVHGLNHLFVNSHLEAAKNEREHNIVYIRNEINGKFDVYVTAKKDGIFGEYLCWVSEEFEENPELLYTVIDYIIDGFQGRKSVEENLKDLNPLISFNPFPKELHPDLYEAMDR